MASSKSTSSKYGSSICKVDREEGGREEEKIDYKKLLGNMLKRVTIRVQDNFEEWVQCCIIIRERGITLVIPTKQESPQQKTTVSIVMEFSSPQDVGIVMLPDNARRSCESKIYLFTVQNKTPEAKRNTSLRIR